MTIVVKATCGCTSDDSTKEYMNDHDVVLLLNVGLSVRVKLKDNAERRMETAGRKHVPEGTF